MYLDPMKLGAITRVILVVAIAMKTKAEDETIECSTSGKIRSSRLNPRKTYHFTFPNHPNDNTLLMFNVTRARNVKRKLLKFYGDNVDLKEKRCSVFFRLDNLPCSNLLIKNYPSCLGQSGPYQRTSRAITVDKIKRDQVLVIDYDIVYCDTGRVIPQREDTDETPELSTTASVTDKFIPTSVGKEEVYQDTVTTQRYTTTDRGNPSPSSEPIQWSLILAVAMSAVALFAMLILAIVCVCNRRRRSNAERREKAPESTEEDYMVPSPILEEGIYAEIEEPYDELERVRAVTEPPFHRFQLS